MSLGLFSLVVFNRWRSCRELRELAWQQWILRAGPSEPPRQRRVGSTAVAIHEGKALLPSADGAAIPPCVWEKQHLRMLIIEAARAVLIAHSNDPEVRQQFDDEASQTAQSF